MASRLLPAGMRPHVAAVYAFARRADDFADEPGMPDTERRRLLDAWQARLTGDASEPVPANLGADFIFEALHQTIRETELPVPLLTDLLDAFRQDRRDDAIRDVAGAARILPAVGQPGRSDCPAHRRLPERRTR